MGKGKRRMRNRTCTLCGGTRPQAVMLHHTVLDRLQKWSAAPSFAHRECLEILGLHPCPDDAPHPARLSRMQYISVDFPGVEGLGQCVYERA